ncbi:MAG: hypothetical protein JMDDDDMK_03611 [Acidobacteria bacterium]|nr:hypothetical protein [Acidobacteriota bacterium]
MPNEDNTQQMSNSNSQVIAAIRSLEDRVANVEQIIVARLNTTRPLDQELLARLDELVTGQTVIREEQAAMRAEQAAMRAEQAAMRADYERFREETDENFRKIIERQDILNNDNLDLRLEHRRQSKRISRLEEAHTK